MIFTVSVPPPQNAFKLQRGMSDFIVEKPGRHHPDQVITVNITCNVVKDGIKLTCHRGGSNERDTASLLWYVCQWYITECYHKEITDKSKLRHILQNIWPVIWSWKLRGKLRKSSRLKRQWITQCNVWFWTGSFCYKRYYWSNTNRAKWLNGSSVLMLIFWFCWLSCSYIGECPYW